MLRSLIKTGGSHAFHLMGIDRRVLAMKPAPVVLGYHRVVEDFSAAVKHSIPAMLIRTKTLERHLDWVGQHFDFVSLDELGAGLAGDTTGGTFKRPVAAITFDDGYADVYEQAFPLLWRKGIPAAVFVVSDLVDTPQPLLHDLLFLRLCQLFARWRSPQREIRCLILEMEMDPHLAANVAASSTDPFCATRAVLAGMPQRDVRRFASALEEQLRPSTDSLDDVKPLSREMLTTMHRAGVTIGSHTRTHVILTNEMPRRVEQELQQSRYDLEAILQAPVRHFAYPDGRFNNRIVQAVSAAGYRYAYGTCGHVDAHQPLLTIPRRVLWEGSCTSVTGTFSSAIMGCQITGFFDLANRCEQNHLAPNRIALPFKKRRKVGEEVGQKVGMTS